MKKLLKGTTQVTFDVNSYFISNFSWQQENPDDMNTARLIVVYALANEDNKGSMNLSPMPEHRGVRLDLYNVGNDLRLSNFLLESGKDKKDIFDFNYKDLQRLIEVDIFTRFGFTTKA